jgi:hypothetical protein
MTTIYHLPSEIIDYILCYIDILSIQDCVNFSLTCHYFYDMIENNNTFWGEQFYKRYVPFSIFFLFSYNFTYFKILFDISKYFLRIHGFLCVHARRVCVTCVIYCVTVNFSYIIE